MIKDDKKINIPADQSPFNKSRVLQEEFARALRGITREIGKLIKGYKPIDQISVEKLKRALRSYADILEPWAYHLVGKMIKAIESQDKRAWIMYSKQMSIGLRNELTNAPIGDVVKDLMDQQVRLIKSIPLEAGERVHKLVMENLYEGKRAEDIAQKILETESISKSRATLIARTEIARAASKLTQARAEYVKSDGYIWRTSQDSRVRDSHKKMHGKFVKWSEPPTLDKMVGHAGCFPNCRCYPEPIIPEFDYKKEEK